MLICLWQHQAGMKSPKQRRFYIFGVNRQRRAELYNMFDLSEADRRKFKLVQEKFKVYCTPQKNIVFERFNFWKLCEALRESIDVFVTSLRLKAKTCELGEQEESIIRDRIVLWCLDVSLQEWLLRENDLTLTETLQICRAAETTKQQMKLLRNKSGVSRNLIRCYTYNNCYTSAGEETASRDMQSQGCYKCGAQQARDRNACPAISKKCMKCGKTNHFATVCRSEHRRQSIGAQQKSTPKPAQKRFTQQTWIICSTRTAGRAWWANGRCYMHSFLCKWLR